MSSPTPPFSLTRAIVNPANLKCTTLPIFAINNVYSRAFHLSWLGFFVAFLSWFAFSPLIPESIKTDLKLTSQEIGNSNVMSLCATLLVRLVVGPLVDRYGPRKVMATLLVLGAIPSGLAGTVTTVNGLYIIRFFIGILGGTFVTCQAWTTAFFDKSVVGRANALAGGWGNAGGGVTFIVMIALYNTLIADGLSKHVAWRAAFAIVPVPILLGTAALVMIFGQDHPAGRWADRFKTPGVVGRGSEELDEGDEKELDGEKGVKGGDVQVQVSEATEFAPDLPPTSTLDIAVNKPVTWEVAAQVIRNPLTWLPSLAYLTTFGYELAIDANLANVLYALYKNKTFGQTKAGYIASIFGLLNIVTRPLGGYFGDFIYRYRGVPGKKYLTITCGLLQGLMSIGLGLYMDSHPHPDLTVIIVFIVFMAIFNEVGNGANFALVPHCNPNSNGLMSGIVGACGNVGGILFAMIFRFQPTPAGKAFWISGAMALAVNMVIVVIPVPAL
ncbi:hypothetical protein JAAARDRAFT_70218 [Jaapia argillacea MUCL 33604]|uniref:Nitrate/nitrite transporter n=1 Tax=Jaapia argillacea MUCL 33604 TaxID=933084 RepID=A0A067PR46_9AGAM|nr:hypothetical protein JAAARDRAFT_70218 [Jaapia argillacea MUCL 33604]